MVTVVMKKMTNWRVRDQIRVISLHDQPRLMKFIRKVIPEKGRQATA